MATKLPTGTDLEFSILLCCESCGAKKIFITIIDNAGDDEVGIIKQCAGERGWGAFPDLCTSCYLKKEARKNMPPKAPIDPSQMILAL